MEEYLDLTPFCWKPVAWDKDTLRIIVTCAEGLSTELQSRLKELGIVATRKGRGSLEVARQKSVQTYIGLMDIMPSYRQCWEEYFLACDRIHRGVRADMGLVEERRRAVRRVLAAAPKLDVEGME